MNKQQWYQQEQKAEKTRKTVIAYCIFAVMLVTALWVYSWGRKALTVSEDTNTVSMQFRETPLVAGRDYPTNSDGSGQIVEKGASLKLIPASTNQPKPVSEKEVLERQERARNSQRNAEAMKARGVK